MAKTTKKKRSKKKKISPEELEKRNHIKDIRNIFTKAGFDRITGVCGKHFKFNERMTELDDIFIYENVILVVEYTNSSSNKVSEHLFKKKIIFDHIYKNKEEFVEFMDNNFENFKASRDSMYNPSDCQLKIIYCSRHDFDMEHKQQVSNVVYLDYPELMYFKRITDTIKKSSRFEIFSFLGLKYKQIGKRFFSTSQNTNEIMGSILPESFSNFSRGYKVVTFYIEPELLLSKAYVLRKNGWRDDFNLYQRMILPSKIRSIRKHLNEKKRVFINNIIVTLPKETTLLNENGEDIGSINATSPVMIKIPDEFNTIGLIDGQHRVFAYYEGDDKYEPEINKLRAKQNLLLTGIKYPSNVSDFEKNKFEATLFLEINSTQTNANSELRQQIELLLNPFASISIAKALIHRLNGHGPLSSFIEEYFYDKKKLKTTSIVAYGLKPLVKFSGEDSLFNIWDNDKKDQLLNESNAELLEEYIKFCVNKINIFLGAIKSNIKDGRWDINVKDSIIKPTYINGFIVLLRNLIKNNKVGSFNYYNGKFSGIDKFAFKGYKSSQWTKLANDLYKKFF